MADEFVTTVNPDIPASGPDQAQQSGDVQDLASQINEDTIIEVSHPDFEQQGDSSEPATPDQTGQDQAGADAGPSDQADLDANSGQDQSGNTEPVMTLKVRGQEIPIKDRGHLKNLAQMGLDYNAKLHILNPHLDTLKQVMAAQNDPARAAQLNAILTGQPVQVRCGCPARASPRAGKPAGQIPRIPIRDAEGNSGLW